MATYSIMTSGKEGQKITHFYVDGKRVDYARVFYLRDLAQSKGRIDCFRTEIKGGRVRQHSVYTIPDGYEA